MGNSGSIPASAVGEARARTQLNEKDVQRLRRRFQKFVGKDKTEATLQQFSSLPELAGNPYLPRLFNLMDTDKNGSLSFIEFCVGMSMYKSLQGTNDGKFQLLLQLHDMDGDEKLSSAELADLIKMAGGKAFSDQQLQQVVKSLMTTYDLDGDGALNLLEFSSLVKAIGVTLRL